MKKVLLLSTVLTAAAILAGSVEAKPFSGGFVGPAGAVSTVEQVKEMKDDAKVVMQGTIEKSLGGENYEFKDSTGTIKVEIDNDEWAGQTVTPKDKVEIRGEVDKGWFSIEVDVDSINKM